MVETKYIWKQKHFEVKLEEGAKPVVARNWEIDVQNKI